MKSLLFNFINWICCNATGRKRLFVFYLNVIHIGMEKQHLTILTPLDFSNAFDGFDFDVLLEVLRSLNTFPAVIDWFRNCTSVDVGNMYVMRILFYVVQCLW